MVIRPAYAAGDWYPADADELITSIAELLLAYPVSDVMPYALVVPHNKLSNGGQVSAAAFRHLTNLSKVIDDVIVLAAVEDDAKGVVLPICERFSTPLGSVALNQKLIQSLSLLPFVSRSDRTHLASARIEVQLPFLQTCLTSFNLLPILVGEIALDDLILLFNSLPSGRNTLLVLSLDTYRHEHQQDNQEKLILKSFQEYCGMSQLKIVSAVEDGITDDCFQSFIAH